MLRRLALAAAVSLVVLAPAAAWGHVHVDPPEITKGGDANLTFSVPNEMDKADTVKVDVKLPSDHPLASVAVKPKPGWTVKVITAKLAKPLKTDTGTVTEAPSEIVWSGGKIAPGQFDQFEISVGPVPTDTDQLTFPTIQTYSNGQEVAWIDPTPAGGPEPDHPAPIVKLVAEAGTATTTPTATKGVAVTASDVSKKDLDRANQRATIGVIVGCLGLIVGIGALVMARRASPT